MYEIVAEAGQFASPKDIFTKKQQLKEFDAKFESIREVKKSDFLMLISKMTYDISQEEISQTL